MVSLASADLVRNRMALRKFALALYAHLEICEQVCEREREREMGCEREIGCVFEGAGVCERERRIKK